MQWLVGYTICPRSLDPFYIAIYFIKWLITSSAYSRFTSPRLKNPCKLLVYSNEQFWLFTGGREDLELAWCLQVSQINWEKHCHTMWLEGRSTTNYYPKFFTNIYNYMPLYLCSKCKLNDMRIIIWFKKRWPTLNTRTITMNLNFNIIVSSSWQSSLYTI